MWPWVVAGIFLVGALVAGLVVWRLRDEGAPPGPEAVAERFLSAWEAGDVAQLRSLVVDPASLDGVDPVAAVAELAPRSSRYALGAVTRHEGAATAPFTAEVEVGGVGPVGWEGALPLVRGPAGWAVAWTPQAVHPRLPDGGGFNLRATWAERAPILGVEDQPLTEQAVTVTVGAEPQRIQDRPAVAAALAETLGVDAAAFGAALDAPGVQPDHFVPIVEVSRARYDAVRDLIHPLPGLVFREGTGRQPLSEGFARHVVGRFGEVTAERLAELGPPYEAGDRVGLDGLEADFETQLAGRPRVDVELVDADGAVVEVLASQPGVPPAPLRTTLDPVLQAAAEAALDGLPTPGALVAVDGATGQVRASVSRPLAEDFDRALRGSYPPGSTFKVVTTYALLAAGLDPATVVDCPPTVVVDGAEFVNFEGGAPGPEPFADAFAHSCNTAIISQAAALPDGALAAAATTLGFGVDYSSGLSTVGGSFPAPTSPFGEAASAIGQSAVEASPLHLASVAAAVAAGSWRSPVLLTDRLADQVVHPLAPAVAAPLQALMRRVVSEGTGTAADVAGLDVIGKSGTAEFGQGDPLPTHAWFIAATGNLGIAVLLEGGGVGGRDAAPVMARFLQTLAPA
jgi:cell division protein FtsI/penicillin-binding protein 2